LGPDFAPEPAARFINTPDGVARNHALDGVAAMRAFCLIEYTAPSSPDVATTRFGDCGGERERGELRGAR